jgi:hypothetical protein
LWNLDLDDHVSKGCDGLRDYLTNNPNATDDGRAMCGIELRGLGGAFPNRGILEFVGIGGNAPPLVPTGLFVIKIAYGLMGDIYVKS